MKKLPLPDFSDRTFANRERPHSASIIIDNYNYAKFVGDAIKSALAQTYPVQVIVVDDGSTDDSRNVIKSFGDQIEIVFKENGGHASAFNAGFAKAAGDIIFFLDSDDLMEPNAVETVLQLWDPGSVLSHYLMTMIDSDNKELGVIPAPPAILEVGDVRAQLLSTGNFGSTLTSGLAFSHKALSLVMPVPEKIFIQAADGFLIRAVAFLGPVQKINSRLARYRIHGRNDSNPWSDPQGCAAGFRKKIRYSQNQFYTTKLFAGRYQLPVATNLGEKDADFLSYRLFSLLLDPMNHPIKKDRRFMLAARYCLARLTSSWPSRRRAMSIVLAIAAAFASPSKAMTLIRWMHKTESRPRWFRALAGFLRKEAQTSIAIE